MPIQKQNAYQNGNKNLSLKAIESDIPMLIGLDNTLDNRTMKKSRRGIQSKKENTTKRKNFKRGRVLDVVAPRGLLTNPCEATLQLKNHCYLHNQRERNLATPMGTERSFTGAMHCVSIRQWGW